MPATQTITQSLSARSGGTGRDDVFLKPFMGGVRILWTALVAVDRTNALNRIELGAMAGTSFYLIASAIPGAAQVSVQGGTLTALPGDFRVGATFVGAVAGDVLEIFAYGIVLPVIGLNL